MADRKEAVKFLGVYDYQLIWEAFEFIDAIYYCAHK